MERHEVRRISLCAICGACPEVTLDPSSPEVCIGEDGNMVRLSREAWNTLVEKIRQGELTTLQ